MNKYWDGRLPVNVVELCRKAGYSIHAHDFQDNTQSETGMIDGKPTIRLRRELAEKLHSARTRFVIAHCMGHIVLHRSDLKELT